MGNGKGANNVHMDMGKTTYWNRNGKRRRRDMTVEATKIWEMSGLERISATPLWWPGRGRKETWNSERKERLVFLVGRKRGGLILDGGQQRFVVCEKGKMMHFKEKRKCLKEKDRGGRSANEFRFALFRYKARQGK